MENAAALRRFQKATVETLRANSVRSMASRIRGNSPSKGTYANVTGFTQKKYLQNSTVKVSYTPNKQKGHWAAHGRYLARAGAQKDGERGHGFNATEEEVNISKTLNAWEKAGDKRIFRLIVSPEQAHKLDLQEHAREMMSLVEKDLGSKLEWVGISHFNTDNFHCHIIIRGKDENGKALRLEPTYIRSGFRNRSREVATKQIGYQLKDHVLERRKRAIEQKRITELDREILKNVDAQNQLSLEGPSGLTPYQQERRQHLLGRLQFLESMGFAKRKTSMTWEVSNDLYQGLKTFQLSQDIIKRKAQHLGQISDPSQPFVYSKLSTGDRLVGKVIGFGLHDELRDKKYLLIEGIDGRVHYTHPTGKMVKDREAWRIKNNDILSLEPKTFTDKKSRKKVSYLAVQNWGNLDKIKLSGSVEADRYILNEPTLIQDLKAKPNLSTFRGQFLSLASERSAKLKKPIKIVPEDLKRMSRLMPIYQRAIKAGWLTHSEANLINFVGAAVQATRVRGNAVKTFINSVKNKRWFSITLANEDRAIQAIKNYRRKSPQSFEFERKTSLRKNENRVPQSGRAYVRQEQINDLVKKLSGSLKLR